MTIATEPIVIQTVKTTADVLRHAALLIEERGWCQGIAVHRDGRVCAVGAIRVVVEGSDHDYWPNPWAALSQRSVVLLTQTLKGRIPADYNDSQSRTAAEVIAALRAAADAA